MFGMMCNLLRNNGGHFHPTVTPAIADGSEEFPSFFPFFSLFFFFIFLLFSPFRLSGLEFWLSCDVLASSLQVPELRLHNVSSCNTMAIPCEIVSLHPPIMYGHHEATFSSPASVATFLAKLASPRLLVTCRTRTINLRPHIPCNHFADSDGTQVCSFPVRVVVFFVLLFTNQSAGVPANVSSVRRTRQVCVEWRSHHLVPVCCLVLLQHRAMLVISVIFRFYSSFNHHPFKRTPSLDTWLVDRCLQGGVVSLDARALSAKHIRLAEILNDASVNSALRSIETSHSGRNVSLYLQIDFSNESCQALGSNDAKERLSRLFRRLFCPLTEPYT